MAGNLLTYEYKSLSGEDYTVHLYDKDLVTSGTTINGDPAEIHYDCGEQFNAFAPIVFSKCDTYFEVSNSTIEGQIESVIDGDENQFYIIIEKDSNVYWRGVVNRGDVVLPRQSYPYVVRISASDGIKNLENIEKALGDDTELNMIMFFKELLRGTNIQNANISSSTNFITTACRYYENQMQNAFDATVDPLRYTRMYDPKKLAIRSETNGEIQYHNFLELLEWALKAWGLRLFMQDGHFHIIQVDAYSLSTMRLHSYTENIDFDSAGGVITGSATITNFIYAKGIAQRGEILVNDNYSYAPALRKVVLKKELSVGNFIQPKSYFDDLDTEITFGNVVAGTFNNGLVITLDGVGPSWSYSSVPSHIQVEFLIYVRVGSYTLDNTNGAAVWSTSSGAVFTDTITQSVPQSPWVSLLPVNSLRGYLLGTPPLPASAAVSLQFDVNFYDLNGNDITSSFTIDSYEGSVTIEYGNFNALQAPQEGITYVYGENTASSYVLELGETPIADNPGTLDAGKLQVYDGTNWDEASTWRRFEVSAPSNRLLLVLIEAIYRKQQQALHILNCGLIRNDVSAINTITVDSLQLLLLRGRFATGEDEWREASWIELREYDSGPTGDGSNYYNPSTRFLKSAPNVTRLTPTSKIQDGALSVSKLSAEEKGTVTTLDVKATGVDVANSGDLVYLINPLNGESDELELTADWNAADTSISFSSITLSQEYPEGSILTVPIKNILSRIYTLENPT